MGREMRSWRSHRRSDNTLTDLAKVINAEVQGWINYFGCFYRSELVRLLRRINEYLVRWATWKYKRLRRDPPKHAGSWPPSSDESQACSHTGGSARAPTAGRWEPDEPRGHVRLYVQWPVMLKWASAGNVLPCSARFGEVRRST